jgi:zinc finger protein
MVSDLSQDQPLRRYQDPASHAKIQAILDKLKLIVPDDANEEAVAAATPDAGPGDNHEKPVPPFTVKLHDPSGNSFLEFIGSMADAKWSMREYTRTLEDNIALGLVNPDSVQATNERVAKTSRPTNLSDWVEAPEVDEVLVFQGTCSSCGQPLDTRMKRVIFLTSRYEVHARFFLSSVYHSTQEIIIMSTNCDACGYKDNEVKTSSAISEKGKIITLKVEDVEDLSRDILKVWGILSDKTLPNCRAERDLRSMQIPEIELQLHSGTLGGRFTTLEGILDQIYDEISGKLFESGDSTDGNSGLHRFLGQAEGGQDGLQTVHCHLGRPGGKLVPAEHLCSRP